jgi:hypothetical protein
MPDRPEHNRICVEQGFEEKLCEAINKWMDEPATEFPGCQHRNFRHSKNDCDLAASQVLLATNDLGKARDAALICMLHRLADRKADKGCGCKPLFEDR